jgi:hypothetical protein
MTHFPWLCSITEGYFRKYRKSDNLYHGYFYHPKNSAALAFEVLMYQGINDQIKRFSADLPEFARCGELFWFSPTAKLCYGYGVFSPD